MATDNKHRIKWMITFITAVISYLYINEKVDSPSGKIFVSFCLAGFVYQLLTLFRL